MPNALKKVPILLIFGGLLGAAYYKGFLVRIDVDADPICVGACAVTYTAVHSGDDPIPNSYLWQYR